MCHLYRLRIKTHMLTLYHALLYRATHINILESCNQPGIDNKSSNFISEMVSCLEIKIQWFFCKKFLRFEKHTL